MHVNRNLTVSTMCVDLVNTFGRSTLFFLQETFQNFLIHNLMTRSKKQSSNSGSGKSDNKTTIKSNFHNVLPISTAAATSSLGVISTATGTGMLSLDVNLSSLTDIFRLYRINSITFELAPASGKSTAAVEIPAGFLGYTPFGIATAPTTIADFETPLVSKPTVPFGTSTTTTAPLTRECGTLLHLINRLMPVLQGAGGGWLATQDDGTQTNWGTLWWAMAATTAANTLDYMLSTYFDISFKDLLDPASISKLMARHPSGLPHYIDVPVGSDLHTAHVFQRKKWSLAANPSPTYVTPSGVTPSRGGPVGPCLLSTAMTLSSRLAVLSSEDIERVEKLIKALSPPTEDSYSSVTGD